MTYIKRHMEDTLRGISGSWPVLLLTGPRQAGKTTLLRKLMEEEGGQREYITLDDLSMRDLAKRDPKLFLELHQPPLLIDEVQYAPELFHYIKMHVDECHQAGAFWLTGSQIFRLMRGVQESLAGRVAILHLSPLSQRELFGYDNVPFSTELSAYRGQKIAPQSTAEVFRCIWQGSMPALAGSPDMGREVYYSSYISTYIQRDVQELYGALDALKFLRFLTSAAARTAQLVNYKSMAEDAEIDVATAKEWLQILETLGLVFLLHPYTNNVLKRTIKTPKLYFYDTGLVAYLTRWSSPEVLEAGAMNGAILENYTISEILKGYENAGLLPYLHYYRDRDAKEIDVVMEKDGLLLPLEIKKTKTPDPRILRTFGVLDKAPLQRGRGAILCLADSLSAVDSNHLIIPIWMI